MTSASLHIQRSINLRFWMATIVIIGVLLFSYIRPIVHILQQNVQVEQGYHNELASSALSSDALSAFLAILGTLPLSAEYLENLKSKFVRFYLIRDSYSGYLLSNLFACWICGGGVILLGGLVAWGVTTLIVTPMEYALESYVSITPQISMQLVLLFLNGGLWAVLGMTMSTIMESKYIAYASPFIVYYLLVILYERYFPNAWLLYPKNWLNPEIWPYGIGSAALFLLELTFLCGLVFYIRGKRRLEQL